MSTIDTSTWSNDTDLNVSIEGIPLNADSSISQTWLSIRALMAALKGDGDAIRAFLVPFTGATASADGTQGLVPAPEAGDQSKVLQGDGTWGTVAAANHTHGNVTNDGKLGTASRAVVTDGDKKIAVSSVTSAELGYLSGVTSALQTQLNAKANDSAVVHLAETETVSGEKTFSSQLICSSRSNGFRCTVGSYSMSFMIGSGGVNRGVWDYSLNKWVVYQDASQSYFNGTVNSGSDERLKTPMEAFPDAVLDAWDDVNWGQFRYLAEIKTGKTAVHAGVVAQRILEAFEAHGLDAENYSIVCREEMEDGAGGFWMVRYTEALALEAACQRRRAKRLEARIAALEERLNG